jgi:hypothetical protein
MLNRAYVYTVQKHGTQKRWHPYRTPSKSAVHDRPVRSGDDHYRITRHVEDTLATIEDIEAHRPRYCAPWWTA